MGVMKQNYVDEGVQIVRCRNLWAAVLQNAVDGANLDIIARKPKPGATAKQIEEAHKSRLRAEDERDQHRKFIAKRFGNFDWICSTMLDLDPGRVSRKMVEKFKPLLNEEKHDVQ